MTLPVLSIVFAAVGACIAILGPILLFIGLRRPRGLRLFPAAVGVLVFLLFTFALEAPAHNLLLHIDAVDGFVSPRPWASALLASLVGGLFQATGMLCVFYFLLRRRFNTLGSALSYGIGHGGANALVFTGAPLIAILVRNYVPDFGFWLPGALRFMLGDGFYSLAGSQGSILLAQALLRIVVFAFHLAAAVLVWMAASGRSHWGLYFLAILAHAALNFSKGLYGFGLVGSIWLVLVISAVFTAAVCVLTAWLYEKSAQTYTPLLHYDPASF